MMHHFIKLLKIDIFVAVCLLFFWGYAQEPLAQKTNHTYTNSSHMKPHYAGGHFKVTDNGIYSLELRLKNNKLVVGRNQADVIIHRDTGSQAKDVVSASINVIAWMPDHNHGVMTMPIFKERGAGLYTVENLDIIMEGRWELRFKIESEYGNDQVFFSFADVMKENPIGHQGQHMETDDKNDGMTAPKGTNLSGETVSLRGKINASYKTMLNPIPINRIHAWHLTLTDLFGKPVNGATIKVDGDMPAHGHGMPTKPEVTNEISPGVYLVEGMKFNMPGHWIVFFYINTKKGTDTISFNLEIR